MTKIKLQRIYADYILSRINKKRNEPYLRITQIARKYRVSRNTINNVVYRIEKGYNDDIKNCTKNSKLSCLWECKYKIRYLALPKDRRAETVELLRLIIKEMKKDGFPVILIGQLMNKDRTTILHHLDYV